MRLADQLKSFARKKKPGMNNDYKSKTPWISTQVAQSTGEDRTTHRLFKEWVEHAQFDNLMASVFLGLFTKTVSAYGRNLIMHLCPNLRQFNKRNECFHEEDAYTKLNVKKQHRIIADLNKSNNREQICVLMNTHRLGSYSNPVLDSAVACFDRDYSGTKLIDIIQFANKINKNMHLLECRLDTLGSDYIKTLWATRHLKDEVIQEEALPELEGSL